MKNKDFRKLLNEKYPLKYEHSNSYRNPHWGNKKRLYGDYLWFCDREMFNDIKRRYEENPANFSW